MHIHLKEKITKLTLVQFDLLHNIVLTNAKCDLFHSDKLITV